MLYEKPFTEHLLQLWKKVSEKRYNRYTLYPEIVISEIRYIRFVKSDMGCFVISGIRYIGYSLYLVCAKKILVDTFVTLNNVIREIKTLHPNFEKVLSEFMYVLYVMYVLRKLSPS